MNYYNLLPVIAIFIIVIFVLFLMFILKRRKKLSKAIANKISRDITSLSDKSYEEQIINLDKILDFALFNLGKHGSMGEKLKKSNRNLSNIDDVWYAHKTRNKIAHEINYKIDERTFNKIKKIYFTAFNSIGVNIK